MTKYLTENEVRLEEFHFGHCNEGFKDAYLIE